MSASTVPQQIAAGTYAVDASHSRIGFVARHAMITKVRGSFNEFEGSGQLVGDDLTQSTLGVKIAASSIDTRNDDRDGHLRGDDFFDVDNHQSIEFNSTSIARVDDQNFKVTGDLVIKGVSKPVTFDIELGGTAVDPWGNTRLGLEGSAVINRKDWDLTWNSTLDAGGVLVSDKITLELEISAIAS